MLVGHRAGDYPGPAAAGLILARADGLELHRHLPILICGQPEFDRALLGRVLAIAVPIGPLEDVQGIVARGKVLERMIVAPRMDTPPTAPTDDRQTVGPDETDPGILQGLARLGVYHLDLQGRSVLYGHGHHGVLGAPVQVHWVTDGQHGRAAVPDVRRHPIVSRLEPFLGGPIAGAEAMDRPPRLARGPIVPNVRHVVEAWASRALARLLQRLGVDGLPELDRTTFGGLSVDADHPGLELQVGRLGGFLCFFFCLLFFRPLLDRLFGLVGLLAGGCDVSG